MYALPLTVMACTLSWDDYFNLHETIPEMVQHLMDEDKQQTGFGSPEGTPPYKRMIALKSVVIPPNDNTIFVRAASFPGAQGSGTADNLVNLSDVQTEASNTGARPKGIDPDDESKILGHFSDALDEMAQCIVDLEDGYFMAPREIIGETEKALQDISLH